MTTCLFAAAFAAVDTVSQTVGRVQRAAEALLEGSFSPLRLLVALILSGAACWGFLALVDLAAEAPARSRVVIAAACGGWH